MFRYPYLDNGIDWLVDATHLECSLIKAGGGRKCLSLKINLWLSSADCEFAGNFCKELYVPRSFIFRYLYIASQFVSELHRKKKKPGCTYKEKIKMRILPNMVMLKEEPRIAGENASS